MSLALPITFIAGALGVLYLGSGTGTGTGNGTNGTGTGTGTGTDTPEGTGAESNRARNATIAEANALLAMVEARNPDLRPETLLAVAERLRGFGERTLADRLIEIASRIDPGRPIPPPTYVRCWSREQCIVYDTPGDILGPFQPTPSRAVPAQTLFRVVEPARPDGWLHVEFEGGPTAGQRVWIRTPYVETVDIPPAPGLRRFLYR